MRRFRTFAALAVSGTMLATAGCALNPFAAPPPPIVVPMVPAYVHGDLIGGRAARIKKARAAGIKPLSTINAWDYVQRQEIELRRQTAGTGVEVLRSGELLLLRLPASGTFDVGKSEIRPQALSTVTEIGLTLKRFNQSLVDVLGHTDSTGTAAANQALSQKRAESVAKQLRSHCRRSGMWPQ